MADNAKPTRKTTEAELSRALAMADCVLGNLLAAYENNDMDAVKRMLSSMSRRRNEAVVSMPVQQQLAMH